MTDPKTYMSAPCLRSIRPNSDGTFNIVASTEMQDSHGDIIRVKGWDLTRYTGRKNGGTPVSGKSNPVVMFAHNYEVPPIGVATTVTKDTAAGELTYQARFLQPEEYGDDWPTNIPSPQAIQAMVEAGILRGSSVGFIGHEHRKIEPRDGEPDSMAFWYPREFTRQELIENSIVPIPANPGALARGLDEGHLIRAHLPAIMAALELCRADLNLEQRGMGDSIAALIEKEMRPAPISVNWEPQTKQPPSPGIFEFDPEPLRGIIRAELEQAFDRRLAELMDPELQEGRAPSPLAAPGISRKTIYDALAEIPLPGVDPINGED